MTAEGAKARDNVAAQAFLVAGVGRSTLAILPAGHASQASAVVIMSKRLLTASRVSGAHLYKTAMLDLCIEPFVDRQHVQQYIHRTRLLSLPRVYELLRMPC